MMLKKKRSNERKSSLVAADHMKIRKFNEIELKCDDHKIVRAMNAACTWYTRFRRGF